MASIEAETMNEESSDELGREEQTDWSTDDLLFIYPSLLYKFSPMNVNSRSRLWPLIDVKATISVPFLRNY